MLRAIGRVAEHPFLVPVVIDDTHDPSEFQSGSPELDEWLRSRALDNLRIGASRTYVICPIESRRVVGFYALAMGHILNADVTGAMRRNMPRHIPAVILARLAVDLSMQGSGIGRDLLRDAVLRSMRAAEQISARLVVVHAISDAAETFYLRNGFTRLPGEPRIPALDLVKFRNS